MSAELKGVVSAGEACKVLTEPGQLGLVKEGSRKGAVILRTYCGYVSLTEPGDTWDSTCDLVVEVLLPGTVVIYTSEV